MISYTISFLSSRTSTQVFFGLDLIFLYCVLYKDVGSESNNNLFQIQNCVLNILQVLFSLISTTINGIITPITYTKKLFRNFVRFNHRAILLLIVFIILFIFIIVINNLIIYLLPRFNKMYFSVKCYFSNKL